MHVDLGGYHIRDIEFSAAFDIDADKVGKDLSRGDLQRPEQHRQVLRRAQAGRARPPRHDPRRHRQVPVAGDHEGARRDRRRRPDPAGHQDRRGRQLPAGRLRGGHQVVRRAGARRPAAASSTASPCSSPASPTGARRFEEKGLPIVGDDIKSQVGATIVHRKLARLFQERGVLLERTHQLNVGGNTDFLNMLERERLESQEDLQDQRRHLAARPRPRRQERPHRPVRSRALARGSQVGLHPPRGPLVRRRAAEHRAQARGGRLAQLGRHRDRRRALRQAGARQRHRRRARVAVAPTS